jgi:fatty acid desaturase
MRVHGEGKLALNFKITNRDKGVFRTMGSRDHDVVLVRRRIYLGYWEFGMGRGWGGGEEGEVSLRVT